MSHKVKVLTTSHPESYFLQALLLKERRSKLVIVYAMYLPNEVVGAAESDLLQDPERPIALVLNADKTIPEEIEKRRRALGRILSKISDRDHWHVCLAIPNVLRWVLADPIVKAEFEAAPDRADFCHALPLRIVPMAEQRELDRKKIGEAHPEFLELVDFVQRHALQPDQVI